MVPSPEHVKDTVHDRALLGGIMGFSTDDMRIRNSFDIAREQGIDYLFSK